jgi:hypothetical protein
MRAHQGSEDGVCLLGEPWRCMLLVVVVSTQSAIDVKVERRVRRRVFGVDARHFRTDSNYKLTKVGIGRRQKAHM